LETVAGQRTQTGKDSAAKDVTKLMLGHVHNVPVNVIARLACTELTFEEMSGLHTDDVLLLDKKINTPVELIIDGRIFFKGMLAKSQGKQAVVITERCVGK
jgi:flagellar motor switch protein FliM